MPTQWDDYPKNILKKENIATSSEDIYAVREKMAGSLKAPVSVGQAITVLNSLFKESPILYFCIIGELSKLTIHASGHLYFEMRDQNNHGVISCKMWRNRLAKNKIRPEKLKLGQNLILTGRFSLYDRNGKLDFEADNIIPCDQGKLLEELEELRRCLQAEGLFALERKKALPTFPKVVGVATSQSGQAIQDILRTLKNRCPHIKVVLAPCLCQGAGAERSIIKALKALEQRADIDCVIVGRGGGSQSDLHIYNNEELVRFVASYSKPIISAVGHEGDHLLTDEVADKRASTPTQAAELVSVTRQERLAELELKRNRIAEAVYRYLSHQEEGLQFMASRLPQLLRHKLELGCNSLNGLRHRLNLCNPNRYLPQRRQDLLQKSEQLKKLGQRLWQQKYDNLQRLQVRLQTFLQSYLPRQEEKLANLNYQLQSLSPERVLERGYAVVASDQGHVLQEKDVKFGAKIRIALKFGCLEAKINKFIKGEPLEALRDKQYDKCQGDCATNASLEQSALFD